jgi:hypothetical protein
MKPKNKEVNIFNMSLLDILCGALGAFCFLMLVLFQYWKPEGTEVTKTKENTAQLEQKLQDMMKQMQNMSNLPPDVAEKLKQMAKDFESLSGEMAKLKAMLQQAQAQGEAYRRDAEQARGEAEAAKKEVTKYKMRNPIAMVMTTSTAAHDVDLYVKDAKMDEANPNKVQGVKWPGDVLYNSSYGPASDLWLMRDVPAGEYKVYYKFLDRRGNPDAARVDGYYLHHSSIIRLPRITLPNDRQVYMVGTIRVGADYGSTFTPAPAYEAGYKEQLQRDRQQQQQQQPAPGK